MFLDFLMLSFTSIIRQLPFSHPLCFTLLHAFLSASASIGSLFSLQIWCNLHEDLSNSFIVVRLVISWPRQCYCGYWAPKSHDFCSTAPVCSSPTLPNVLKSILIDCNHSFNLQIVWEDVQKAHTTGWPCNSIQEVGTESEYYGEFAYFLVGTVW